MALITTLYGAPPTFNVRAVEAGDAAEVVSRLTNAVAAASAASETEIADFSLSGAGSGPQWEAWLVTGTAGLPVVVTTAAARFVAAVAGNPTEALLRLKQRLAAANPGIVYKVELAGAGDGPTYMAVALFALPT